MGALAATSADVGVLFLLLALVAFAVAIWLAATRNWVAGLAVAFIGILILIFGLD